MKFGISSYVWVSPFSNHTLSQLQFAKDMGFDIYEIGVEDPDAINIEVVKEEADKAGIEVNICGAFGERRDIGSSNEEFRAEGIQYIKRLVDMAAVTGCPYVAGPMYAATGKTGLASREERNKQNAYVIENMKIVGSYAAEKGIKLALEPLNRFETDFMNTVYQGKEFLDKVKMDNIGFLIDTFHMNIEEKSIPDAIRLAGDKIYDFHACANDRGTPGEDHLDWEGIKCALTDIGYGGPMVIESFTTDIKEIAKAVSLWRPLAESQDELASQGLHFLKKTFKGER